MIRQNLKAITCLLLVSSFLFFDHRPQGSATAQSSSNHTYPEYIWIEAENMRGFSTGVLGEPLLNPSYLDLPKAKAPGWGMNGPGVSAEWSQGGESEWNSAAASADESNATIYQDIEIPRAGQYTLWVRYADWANKSENFSVRVAQAGQAVFDHEFGAKDLVDAHDEVSMYWGWSFAWDGARLTLDKGPARVSLNITKSAGARRNVDCFVLTNDSNYRPLGRQKPEFAANRYLSSWSHDRNSIQSLIGNASTEGKNWERQSLAGRDFMMPWNIAREFWSLLDKPASERPLYPFNAEPVTDFVGKYKGAAEVPIFNSKLIVPVVYINDLPELLKEGSPFLQYLRGTKVPFAVLMNYGTAKMSESEGQAAWKLLSGELKDQFLGWISGESIGFVWDQAPTQLRINARMSRRELLQAHREFYSNAIAQKWRDLFHVDTGPMWSKLIPAQSTSSLSFAHALTEWGVRLLGMETAAVQPMSALRIAFARGAARQFGADFLYYHAPNFGDTATAFTKAQNFAGPDYFYHTRYGTTMGPSLSWYRKSYYLYYMAGASAIYLEQGHDQFFKPGPGEHPFELNPLGQITDEFVHFAEQHPDRGAPYTPIAFLLDPAHGFEMTDYPQWPFEVSQISRSDRALRELFGIAYYPGLVIEGEPAMADRQPFVDGIFGDMFDVITATDGNGARTDVLGSYRAIVVGGRVEWSRTWIERLKSYVQAGGTVVLNTKQIAGLPENLLGIRLTNATAEVNNAKCLVPEERSQDLNGQVFRYDRVELKGAQSLMTTLEGDPLVTKNQIGKGSVIVCAVPDLLGEDERMTPVAAHLLTHIFVNATPVRVRGQVEYLVNKTSTGWAVTLINNRGVYKSQQGLAQVNRTEYATVEVSVTDQKLMSAREWTEGRDLAVDKGSTVNVRVPPGGLNIVELRTH